MASFIGHTALVTSTDQNGVVAESIVGVVAAGDLVLARLFWQASDDPGSVISTDATEGWEVVSAQVSQQITTIWFCSTVLAKVWGSGNTDDHTPSFTLNGTTFNERLGVVLEVYRYVEPIDDEASNSGNSATATCLAATAVGDGNIVTRFVAKGGSSTIDSSSEGAMEYSLADGATNTLSCAMHQEPQDAGSTGEATFTFSGSNPWITHTLVLSPSVATATFSSLTPAHHSTDVAVDTDLVAQFTSDIQAGTGTIELRKQSDDSVVESWGPGDAAVSFVGDTMTITRVASLETLETGYYVAWTDGAIERAADGQPVVAVDDRQTWRFTCKARPTSMVLSLRNLIT